MKAVKYMVAAVVIAGAVAVVTAPKAEATTATCKIEPVVKITDLFNTGHNFEYKTVDGKKTVTGKFKVTGDANCRKEASLAVWDAKTKTGQPLESQVLFDYSNNGSKAYAPGVYSLTAKMPDCGYWQVDLLEGKNPTGFNGTANYGNLMDPVDSTDPLDAGHRRNILDTKLGGKVCEPPKDVCPNIDEMQKEVPEGYKVDENGKCVIIPEDPQTPETPEETPEVKGETTPTILPETGAGAVAATFAGVTASAGAAHAVVRRFLRK